jgi:hypothetical protein
MSPLPWERVRRRWKIEEEERRKRFSNLLVIGEVKTYTWRELPDGHPMKEEFLHKEKGGVK